MNEKLYDIVTKMKGNIFDRVPDITAFGKQLTKFGDISAVTKDKKVITYRNIMDDLQRERNKITDYILDPVKKQTDER